VSELIATVHVTDADGNDQIFSPGETVPGWAAKLITNPKAWSGPVTPAEVQPEPQKRSPGRPAKTAPAQSNKE
jgi:hypothetical protein